MSVNFENEISEEAAARLREIFGEPVEDDQKTFLFDKIEELDRRAMGDLASLTGQPVSVELNDIGTIKNVGGLDFKLLEEGWKME